MGMAGIALCMFISAQTESQIIAAIGGFACMLVVISLNSLAAVVPGFSCPCRETAFYSSFQFFTIVTINLTMGKSFQIFPIFMLVFSAFCGIGFFLF
mgnify:CR=1 FL=1